MNLYNRLNVRFGLTQPSTFVYLSPRIPEFRQGIETERSPFMREEIFDQLTDDARKLTWRKIRE